MPNIDEIEIEPMTFFGPGLCPNCLTPLLIAERDLNVMKLDKNGNVIDIVDTEYYCNALCPKCGEKLRMMRSYGSYKPYSLATAMFDDIDFQEKISKRNKGMYSIDENPVSYLI